MDNDIPEINELIKQFSKLPGLGPKSAKRIILKLINNKEKMVKPLAKSCSSLSVASLVILFLRLLVTTSPIGVLRANETAAGGLSFSLSLSCCGYRSVTF